jgi:hypothetical protein
MSLQEVIIHTEGHVRQQAFPFIYCTFKADESDIQRIIEITDLANNALVLRDPRCHKIRVRAGPLEESKESIRREILRDLERQSGCFRACPEEHRIALGEALHKLATDFLSAYGETDRTFELLPVDEYNHIFDGLWEAKTKIVESWSGDPLHQERFINALENYHTFNSCFERQLEINKAFHYKSFTNPLHMTPDENTVLLEGILKECPHASHEEATLFQPLWER